MIRVDRKLNSTDVVDALTDLFMPHAGRPGSFAQTTSYEGRLCGFQAATVGHRRVPMMNEC